jgi:hypothetical protein
MYRYGPTNEPSFSFDELKIVAVTGKRVFVLGSMGDDVKAEPCVLAFTEALLKKALAAWLAENGPYFRWLGGRSDVSAVDYTEAGYEINTEYPQNQTDECLADNLVRVLNVKSFTISTEHGISVDDLNREISLSSLRFPHVVPTPMPKAKVRSRRSE